MPTYDYACRACGHTFEQFQSIKAEPLRVCPQCEQETLARLLGTGAGVLFKGNGFYITDYRPESYTKAATADSGSGTPAANSSSSSSSSANGANPNAGTATSSTAATSGAATQAPAAAAATSSSTNGNGSA